ncbi:DUF1294 domain-containing protein [Mesorhizobium sp. RSR565B]|uniref:DUF1294 domain-containing protein n=1 Tax=unclassified Mesorhizobium TaxID=325217 RepID=UPI0003CEB7B2|nr:MULTISPECIES: DUF1294 domain-containing protein [unclassified Mesorhizobium]ESX86350.1 membrane protein [Mesorhizobium sp. LSHC412B00]ESZ44627.1 membrane protein [Mesorhizobium sp. L103C565B0]
MPGQFAIGVIGYAVAVNLLAYATMSFDKAKAKNGAQRIPESTLLTLAIIGGSIGTVIAQKTIRHKTRKEPFRSSLARIVLLQVLAVIAIEVGLLFPGLPEALSQLLTFGGEFGGL